MSEEKPEWLSPRAIAKIMSVSADTVIHMIERGELEAIKFGHQWRVKRSSFEAYLAKQAQQPGKGASNHE
jgi:excisionase family DNA binding protein